jgi:SecD/SecF fusion protein
MVLTLWVELPQRLILAKIFGEVTSENIGKNLPIVYDGETISYPQVQSAITGGEAQITGMSSFEEADNLATQIRIGSLSLQLSELESSVVGAQLGSQAIASSLKAGAIGLAIVMVFMIVMYAVPGIAASLALAIYTTLVIATLYLFDITLTLPGIAGIILGIGMAVDANVIVFARIREEIATGKSVQTSMKIGFQKAMSAILDGNITTLIASVVLMALGSGTVKGFAYTLMIGIILSLFTAMVVTRYILYSLYALGLKSEKLYGRAKERKSIDFIGKKAVFFTISGIIIAAGLISMGVHSATEGKALNYGLDFMGGTSTTADFGKDMTIEDIENDIVPYVEKVTGDSDVQATKVEGTTQVTIKTRTLSLDERQELEDTLAENCDVDASTITSQSISSTISGEMRSDALKAVIVSCIFMLLYIWFRFKDIRFAASAILALVHDVLVVITVYALVRISVGSTFIACVLTIVGYSINDTIVIFDRIRENLALKTGKQTAEDLREIANKSLTQTLSRSINTSITTFIMVVMLYILGVASIRDFSLPLMAGLVCGAYSSIYIATELWYVMKVHLGKNKATK